MAKFKKGDPTIKKGLWKTKNNREGHGYWRNILAG